MGVHFEFTMEDILSISLVFNVGCIFFLILVKIFMVCQKTPENTLQDVKKIESEPFYKTRVLIKKSFRITQELLLLSTVILGCVCLHETLILRYPLFFPETYHIPKLLKLTFNMNIGRYLFLSFGNIVMAQNAKFTALIIHHTVALATYATISGYQQNTLLGICGIFMELSSTVTTIGQIMRDCSQHAKNLCKHYIFILVGCDLTFALRGILPITFLTYICYMQSPFEMKTVPLLVFFMSISFFGIINIWMIYQAFTTYNSTLEKRRSRSRKAGSLSSNPSPPSTTIQSTAIKIVDKILKKDSNKDLLESTQIDGKRIVFENNLLSKAAQLSEKKVNISTDTKSNISANQNVQIVNRRSVV